MARANHDTARDDLRIAAGRYAARITPHGGAPRTLTWRGDDLLVPAVAPAASGPEPPMTAQCVLAPWPNRVADGVFAHAGVIHRLEVTEPRRANAIHGFAAARRWEVVEAARDAVELACDVGPEPGWPWPLRLTVRWTLDADEGLRGRLTGCNRARTACPFGFGWHPYLSACGAPLDACMLTVPVRTVLPLDPVRNLPAGPEVPVAAAAPGIASGMAMSGVVLDHCFGGAGRSAAAVATLAGPDGRGVELAADPRFRWFQVYTADPGRGEAFPGVGRAVAVEPMTCPPDALRTGRDLVVLGAGESITLNVGVRAIGPASPSA